MSKTVTGPGIGTLCTGETVPMGKAVDRKDAVRYTPIVALAPGVIDRGDRK